MSENSVPTLDKTIEKTKDSSREPRKYRHKQDFLQQVQREAPALDPATLELAVTAVFGLLAGEIGHGETEQVRALLPPEVRELWPKPGL